MELISSVLASRVSGYRRRGTSRRDSDSLINLLPSWWREAIRYLLRRFQNSVIETYVDFPFQYTLGKSYQVPNAPVKFDNGSIGTLETGTTGLPLTPGAVEPGGVLHGQEYT